MQSIISISWQETYFARGGKERFISYQSTMLQHYSGDLGMVVVRSCK